MNINFKNRIIRSGYRYMAVLITAILLLLFFDHPVLAATSGKTGNISWSIENGTLSIKGSGNIPDFSEADMPPWYESRSQIFSVNIDKNITGIGNMAFYGLTELNYLFVPSSVKYVGKMAFAGCAGLSGISFNEGLKSIGANAFDRCENLKYVNLPQSLETIDDQAFYLCTSLATISVPSGVTDLGVSVFAYCTSLMQAKIECNISVLPQWTFYGCTSLVEISLPKEVSEIGEYAFFDCEQLSDAYYAGESGIANTIENQIKNDVPGFAGVTNGNTSDVSNSLVENTTINQDGTVIDTDREVVDNGNALIEVTIKHTKPSDSSSDYYDFVIDSTIKNEKGWETLIDYAGKNVIYAERLEDAETTVNKVIINVNSYNSDEIPTDIFEKLAGANAIIKVNFASNSSVNIDCSTIEAEELSKEYNLRFDLKKNDKPTKAQKELIGDSESYIIEFEESIPIDVVVEVRLGITYARDVASFCQKPVFREWELMQSVMVDDYGYAEFYLGSLDTQTEYLIVLDMDGVNPEDVIIPDSIADEFGGLIDSDGNKYVITGTKSSWGVTFGQLTLIIVGVIIVSAVIIGVIVRLCFKFKQKNDSRKREKNDTGGHKKEQENTEEEIET